LGTKKQKEKKKKIKKKNCRRGKGEGLVRPA